MNKRTVTRSGALQSRSVPHIDFKDVSYQKNKTHELRVAKVQQQMQQRDAEAESKKRRNIFVMFKISFSYNNYIPCPGYAFQTTSPRFLTLQSRTLFSKESAQKRSRKFKQQRRLKSEKEQGRPEPEKEQGRPESEKEQGRRQEEQGRRKQDEQ